MWLKQRNTHTVKTFFERLYLFLGLCKIAPWVNCPYAPTTPTVHSTTEMATHFFSHHDSPSNLARSRYPRTGLGQIIWWIVKKKWGATGVKILNNKTEKSRISHQVRGGGSGSTRTVDAEPKCALSWNQIQTPKDCLLMSHLLYCVHRCIHLYTHATASHTISNRESRYPPMD